MNLSLQYSNYSQLFLKKDGSFVLSVSQSTIQGTSHVVWAPWERTANKSGRSRRAGQPSNKRDT